MSLAEDVTTRPLTKRQKARITRTAILHAEIEGAISKSEARKLRKLL